MTEFGDIFAGDLATAVFIYGSVIMLTTFAAAAFFLTRQPGGASARLKLSRAA